MIYDTELAYLEDPYLTELETEIVAIGKDEQGADLLFLEATLFYPEGGGQPSDVGKIVGEHGTAQVLHARYAQGFVQHRCEIEGSLQVGEHVKCLLDWNERHRNMRAHTAGHVLHDALMQLPHPPNLFPVKGNHKKCYVEYSGDPLSPALAADLESKCNQIIAANLEAHTRLVDLDELKRICDFVPANLPADKPLRVLWLDGYAPMPCGGTHVRFTGEIRPMKIIGINVKKELNHLKYQIEEPAG